MRKSNRLIAWLLLACMVLSFSACSQGQAPETTQAPAVETTAPAEEVKTTESAVLEAVDYAGKVQLDMASGTAKQEVTVKQFIDGDTTHFHVPSYVMPSGVLKARYLAVNTPESTGKIEEYGKKAASFTKEKLSSAVSIIIESDGAAWEADSTGDRYLSTPMFKE